LQHAGYYTMLIGKFLNGYGATPKLLKPVPGWDDWMALPEENESNQRQNGFDFTLYENGKLHTYGQGDRNYMTNVYSDAVVSVIKDKNRVKPLFAYVATSAVHTPATSSNKWRGFYDTEPFPIKPNFNESDVSDKPTFVAKLPLMGKEDKSL